MRIWNLYSFILQVFEMKYSREINSLRAESTITEKMAAVHFPSNALRSKIFRKANECLLKDKRKTGGRFFYSSKISHH